MAASATCEVYIARLLHLRDHHLGLLNGPENERRSRYRIAADRDRFTLATALLRTAVGQRIGLDASAVVIDRTCDSCGQPHGRPRLPMTGLHTSISHSGDLVAVAITSAGPVGVDVEFIGASSYPEILASVCTREEQQFVHTAVDFYSYWVRKEAVLKATGEGLNRAMTEVVVTPAGVDPALLSAARLSPQGCQMADLHAEDHAGAVAVITLDPVSFAEIDADALLEDV